MPTRFWIWAIVGLSLPIALAIEVADGWLSGRRITFDATTVALVLAQLSAIGAIDSIFKLFDRRLWRFKPVSRLSRGSSLVPPDLRGTWRMEITETTQIPGAAGRRDNICYFVVEQTASEINVRTLFSNAESSSTRAILHHMKGDVTVDFLYELKPHSRDEPYRRGAASYRLARGHLCGTYWNEWGGRGVARSDKHAPELYYDFQEARAALGVPASEAQPRGLTAVAEA